MQKHLFGFFILLFFISCQKENAVYQCKGNCKSYVISGRFYNAVTNTGMGNFPFTLRWDTFRGNCIFCPRKLDDIYKGKTDNNGNFSINVNLDTSFFHDYSVVINPVDNESYYNEFHGYIDLKNSEHINVAFYPKATLKLNLKRTGTDTFNVLTASHSWDRQNYDNQSIYIQDLYSKGYHSVKDTTLTFSTVAGIMTRVTITKSLNGTFVDVKDSMICQVNEPNILTINY